MTKTKHKILLTLSILLFIPCKASANAGVPMIALFVPAFGISLIPIIIIEAVYIAKKLKLAATHAAKTVVSANLVSTLVGVPLTWGVLFGFELFTGGKPFNIDTAGGKILSVTLQAPWLPPYDKHLRWMVPSAGLFLLIPFFLVSWWSEYLVSKNMIKECPAKEIKSAVRNANIVTYFLMALWPLGMFVIN